jgi:hypothetical protein
MGTRQPQVTPSSDSLIGPSPADLVARGLCGTRSYPLVIPRTNLLEAVTCEQIKLIRLLPPPLRSHRHHHPRPLGSTRVRQLADAQGRVGGGGAQGVADGANGGFCREERVRLVLQEVPKLPTPTDTKSEDASVGLMGEPCIPLGGRGRGPYIIIYTFSSDRRGWSLYAPRGWWREVMWADLASDEYLGHGRVARLHQTLHQRRTHRRLNREGGGGRVERGGEAAGGEVLTRAGSIGSGSMGYSCAPCFPLTEVACLKT